MNITEPYISVHTEGSYQTDTIQITCQVRVMYLLEALNFQLFLQRMFCISPLTRRGTQVISSSRTTVYTYGVLLIYVFVVATSVWMMRADGVFKRQFCNGYLWAIIGYFEFIFVNALYVVGVIYAVIQKNHQIQLINRICQIDNTLQLHYKHLNLDYDALRRRQALVIFLFFLYYIVVMAHILLGLIRTNLNSIGVLLFALTYQVEQLSMGLVTVAFVNFMMLIKKRFNLLKSVSTIVFDKDDKFGRNSDATKLRLGQMLGLFKELCELINVLNRSVGVVLIFRTAHDFTLATSQCYLMYWILSDNFGSTKYYLIATLFIWMVQNFIKVGATSFIAHSTIKEVPI